MADQRRNNGKTRFHIYDIVTEDEVDKMKGIPATFEDRRQLPLRFVADFVNTEGTVKAQTYKKLENGQMVYLVGDLYVLERVNDD